MERGKKILLAAHCVLNSNSKITGLSQYRGIFKEAVDIIHDRGIGIIQLPCPEMIMYGVKRWGHVKEQFDTLFYRDNCKKMLEPIMQQLRSYIDADYSIIGVLGIDGSPSCGVNFTCSGDWGGELAGNKNLKATIKNLSTIQSSGVFIEELSDLLDKHGIQVPFIAINESNVFDSLNNMKDFLKNC